MFVVVMVLVAAAVVVVVAVDAVVSLIFGVVVTFVDFVVGH